MQTHIDDRTLDVVLDNLDRRRLYLGTPDSKHNALSDEKLVITILRLGDVRAIQLIPSIINKGNA